MRSVQEPMTLRAAALSFMEGAREGWSLDDLVAWTERALLRPGRLMTRYRFPRLIFQEPGIGVVSYGLPDSAAMPASFLPHSRTAELVRRAHRRVLDSLDGMLLTPPDDRFVQAAIYDGRACRTSTSDGRRQWGVMLTEKVPLSAQVLALFAADLLENRSDYETNLVICGSCERVGFWPGRISRRGCPEHPEAVVSARGRRVPSR